MLPLPWPSAPCCRSGNKRMPRVVAASCSSSAIQRGTPPPHLPRRGGRARQPARASGGPSRPLWVQLLLVGGGPKVASSLRAAPIPVGAALRALPPVESPLRWGCGCGRSGGRGPGERGPGLPAAEVTSSADVNAARSSAGGNGGRGCARRSTRCGSYIHRRAYHSPPPAWPPPWGGGAGAAPSAALRQPGSGGPGATGPQGRAAPLGDPPRRPL